MPLLGAIAWGGVSAHVGGLDVPSGCHVVGGGYDTFCQAGRGAIAGWHGMVLLLGDMVRWHFGWHVVGCHCWVPLLDAMMGAIWSPLFGAIAGCPLLGAIAGAPLLGAIVGCHGWMPLLDAIAGAIVRNHCEKKLTRVLHRSPLHFSLH